MADNDIVKALEQFRKEQEEGYTTALEFGGKRDAEHEGFLGLLGETIDFINRQKAEIERLQKEVERNHAIRDKAYLMMVDLEKKVQGLLGDIHKRNGDNNGRIKTVSVLRRICRFTRTRYNGG